MAAPKRFKLSALGLSRRICPAFELSEWAFLLFECFRVDPRKTFESVVSPIGPSPRCVHEVVWYVSSLEPLDFGLIYPKTAKVCLQIKVWPFVRFPKPRICGISCIKSIQALCGQYGAGFHVCCNTLPWRSEKLWRQTTFCLRLSGVRVRLYGGSFTPARVSPPYFPHLPALFSCSCKTNAEP